MKSTTRENLLLYISRDYKYHQDYLITLWPNLRIFKETEVLRFPGRKLQTGEI